MGKGKREQGKAGSGGGVMGGGDEAEGVMGGAGGGDVAGPDEALLGGGVMEGEAAEAGEGGDGGDGGEAPALLQEVGGIALVPVQQFEERDAAAWPPAELSNEEIAAEIERLGDPIGLHRERDVEPLHALIKEKAAADAVFLSRRCELEMAKHKGYNAAQNELERLRLLKLEQAKRSK